MRGKAMKAATAAACMPRLARGSCRASTARPAGSVSLLDRIRDVVLRLIMLTAVSKQASSQRGKPPAGGGGGECAAAAAVTCRRDDSIRNEAVEECIEFLKRSSAEGDAVKLSSVTAEAVAAAISVENDDVAALRLLSVAGAPEAQSAAVEECIELLKRSSAEGDAVKLSSVPAVATEDDDGVALRLLTVSAGAPEARSAAVEVHGQSGSPEV